MLKIEATKGRTIEKKLELSGKVYTLQRGKNSDVIMIHWYGKTGFKFDSKKATNTLLECSGTTSFVDAEWERLLTKAIRF